MTSGQINRALAGSSCLLWRDKQQLSQVIRQDLALAIDLQRQGTVERGTRHHDHTSTRVEAQTAQVAQPLAVLRVNPLKLDGGARRQARQSRVAHLDPAAIFGRNGVAMGIDGRIA